MGEDIIKKGEIIILKVKGQGYNDSLVQIIKSLEGSYAHFVYVSFSKPYSFVKKFLENNGIDLSQFIVIDCISNMVSVRQESQNNLIMCEGPGNVTQVSIAIDKALARAEGDRILVFDSISNLLVYCSENEILKFLQFLISKLRASQTSTILLTVPENKVQEIEDILSPSCDRISLFEVK